MSVCFLKLFYCSSLLDVVVLGARLCDAINYLSRFSNIDMNTVALLYTGNWLT